MIAGRFNVVCDAMWGSCAKGVVSSYLAYRHKPGFLSYTGMANSGHTAVSPQGDVFVSKALPACAIVGVWLPTYRPVVVLGPTAAFTLEQLRLEVRKCQLVIQSQDEAKFQISITNRLWIHPRAGVITAEHKQREAGPDGTKHVASTMQGCGSFLADKIMRRADLKLAADYPELQPYLRLPGGEEGRNYDADFDPMPMKLKRFLDMSSTILHESSQGFSLDINHGSHYPNCTSRSTTAVQNLADMGLPATYMGDVYLTIRPYPIRVGNVQEEGKTVGYSGDGYPGQTEITWDEVGNRAGMPPQEREALKTRELTTVTKRLRRVFEFSGRQLREAATINGATRIAANFMNYVDWECRDTNDPNRITKKVWDFIHMVEDIAQIPVGLVGTGRQVDHVIDLESS